MIERVKKLGGFPSAFHQCAIAIGNFDGVHRGHQAVLQSSLQAAKERGIPSVVLTFEPHPRSFFAPQIALPRITPAPMKAEILDRMGFDAVVELTFDADFAAQSADAFVDDVLVAGLGARYVVAGFDFHFGKKRQGGPAYLMEAGEQRGFDVQLVDAFRDVDTNVVSSSRIREMLSGGDIEGANDLLGYRFRVRGQVVRGKQLGRTLGFPTANMVLDEQTALEHGIYAVQFVAADGVFRDGVASFGRRPTVEEEGRVLLETYIFDFEGDLYDQDCLVVFHKHLRGEERFDDLDVLVAQMKVDEENARAVLAQATAFSELDHKLSAGEPGS